MHGNTILLLLVQIALILAVSRTVSFLFARIRQPHVMGEMVAGIMLGPSLFGLLFPVTHQTIFPEHSIGLLSVLSQLGVVFFLFLVGLELDPKLLRNRGHTAVVISHTSIFAPLLLGAGLAIYLYPRVFNDTERMHFVSVALFMGAAMAVTAFPVLARILTERNLHKTNVGAVAITCAAVDDVTAWCLLAFVVGIARAEGLGPGLVTAFLSAIYVGTMFLVVRPFLLRLQKVYERQGRLSHSLVALIFILVLASAWMTEAIGIHALFGAFLMGALMPKDAGFVRAIADRLEDFTIVFLLPIFFAYTGLRTQIGLIDRGELWFDTILILFIACLGKFGGSAIAGRVCGLPWREASAVGILMNTRGLMELVILSIGLQEGVITPAVFAMMVIMALVTTFMTTPVLHMIYPDTAFVPVEKTQEKPSVFSVVIPVAHAPSGVPLLRLAALLAGPDPANRRLYALHLSRPVDREAYRPGYQAPTEEHEGLQPLLELAREQNLDVQPISFVSRDIASDIARVARLRDADLILMGFHKPVFSRTILGGTVHRVMTGSESNVGIFVQRKPLPPKRILVPYMGSIHDRLAMELAARLAKHAGAEVTVLHLVRAVDAQIHPERAGAQADIARVFDDPATGGRVELRVVTQGSPVDIVLRESSGFDLVVIGVAEQWGLESQLFGWQSERIAQETECSLLIVRKYQPPE